MEITLNNNSIAIISFFLIVNFLAFTIMLIDKIKSQRKGSARISEGTLFFIASAFGSLGVYAGMFTFRHKTRKWYFLVGIPLLVIENSALLYFVYNFLN